MTDVIQLEGNGSVGDSRITLVVSRFNSFIVDRLLKACIGTLTEAGVKRANVRLIKVPGAVELPVAVKRVADVGEVDAIIALGAIIRGETPHFEIIANECARGLGSIAIEFTVPVIFGVLTVDTVDQAMDRSGEEESNKGNEAAQTALEMISVLRQIE
jgi:6,7-dimethyl-8-ribityllumazine synthase